MARLSPLVQSIITGFLFVSVTLLVGFLSWISISLIELRERVTIVEVRQDKMQEQVDAIADELTFLMHGNAPR